MKAGNKLQTYFKAFSKKDWHQFDLFLNSPFYNTAPVYKRLFDYFNLTRLDEQPGKQWREQVYLYVFPGETFKDGQLRTLLWRMGKLVETYLAVSNLKGDKEALENQLMMALGNRNEWFPLLKKRIKAKTEKYQEKAIDFQALLHSVKLRHLLYYHEDFDKYSSGYPEIKRLIEDLDRFILLAKLKNHTELLFRKQILKEEEDHHFLLDQIKKSGLQSEEPVIYIYAQLVRLKEADDWKLYLEIKQSFQQLGERINAQDQQDILYYLINYIIHLNRQQDKPLYEEMLELYQIGLDSGIFIRKDRITFRTFTNIAILSSAQKKFAWADVFIRTYQRMLEPSKGDLAIKLARAYWNFHQGEFRKVLDWTVEIDVLEGQPEYPFRLMALKLRAYYELYLQDKTYQKLLYNFIASYTKYIRINRQLARQKATAYLNFIRMIKLILKYHHRNKFDEGQREMLRDKIEMTNPLILKSWLLEKID